MIALIGVVAQLAIVAHGPEATNACQPFELTVAVRAPGIIVPQITAPILSPFIYTQIIWMLALGYIFFGDWPDAWTLVGAGVVIASGLYLLYRERVRHIEPKVAP